MPRKTPMRINKQNELWSEYYLADGALLRIKHIVTDISRQLNDDGSLAFNDKGEPIYLVDGTNIVHVAHSPLAMKRPDPVVAVDAPPVTDLPLPAPLARGYIDAK